VTHADTVHAAVTGRVTDSVSGEPVVGALVKLDGVSTSTYSMAYARTDTGGNYAIQVEPGTAKIVCHPVGYREKSTQVRIPRKHVAKLNFRVATGSSSSDSSLRLLRGLPILHFAGTNLHTDSATTHHDNEIRIRVWNVLRSKRGRLAIRKQLWSVEGDALFEYLLVSNGRATYIYNSLADGWCAELHGAVTARNVGVRLVYETYVPAGDSWAKIDYPNGNGPKARLAFLITWRDAKPRHF
jgi:hypothetical protein